MSKGHVQRAIAAAFDAEPKRHFTTRELAAIAYPGTEIGKSQINGVLHAIPSITPALTFCRIGMKDRFGWHHVWGRA